MSAAVTVQVVSYNHLAYLPDALLGIQQQSLQPAVVHITDDCSPNDSEDALRAVVARFPGMTFERARSNLGAVAQLRAAVERVRTEYYMLHAADDRLVDPNFLRDAVEVLDANPEVVAVHGRIRHIDAAGRPLAKHQTTVGSGVRLIAGATLRDQLAVENVVPAVCVVVRTAIHGRLPPFPIDNPLVHDWQQWYLMTYLGSFAVIDRTVMDYRVHATNLSVGRAQTIKRRTANIEGYAQLLARSELSDHDRRALKQGRRRLRRLLLRARLAQAVPRPIAAALRRMARRMRVG